MEHIAPKIHLMGFEVDLAALLMMLVTSVIVLILATSGKLQNFMEWVIEFVQNIIGSTMDSKTGRAFLTLGLTLIMFIFVGNMLGLPFAIVTEHHHLPHIFGQEVIVKETAEHYHLLWWKSPTADAAVTMALAIVVIVLSHYLGITRNTKHYFKHYFQPSIAFFPIHIIEQVSKPLTLGLRLFGNIFAGEVMISVILGAGWFGIPALLIWQGFSIFVGSIQAFVFTMLTMVYISQSIVHEEHEHH
jgi:F-type H+-transporting ATPase subunit a